VQRFLLRPMFVGGVERRDELRDDHHRSRSWSSSGTWPSSSGAEPVRAARLRTPITLGTLPISGNRFVALMRHARPPRLFYLVIKKTWVGRALRGAAQNRVGIQTAGSTSSAGHAGVRRRRPLAAAARRAPGPRLPRLPGERRHLDLKGFEIIVIGGSARSSQASWAGAPRRHLGARLGLRLGGLQGSLRLPATDRATRLPTDGALRERERSV